jgi:phosphomevalonate kinase
LSSSAGGYDAVWVLVVDPPNTPVGDLPLTRVENVWTSWTKLDVSPLSAAESLEKGIRLERLEDVTGLREVLQAA